ncbi:MAG: DUF1016 family protein [Anaerolineaceae bacterium]|nr:DUF1016 family protein [Anaerolineaceae bacterium]
MKSKKRHLGKEIITSGESISMPIPPVISELPQAYSAFISEIIDDIKKQRIRTFLRANSDMICLYWRIGNRVLEKQENEDWGTSVVNRMSKDLKEAFPEMTGFSPRNINYMRKFAKTYPYEFVQRVVAQIPWRTNIVLMEKLDTPESRAWYAEKTISNGWSKTILELQIQSKLMERTGQTTNNFTTALPPYESDLARYAFKDPYIFDFLGTDAPRREVEIERALTDHIQQFLLELGNGFAFVGRQVHLQVGGDDFYLDLLFYHLQLRCFVVIELKACEFEPGFVSQLNMYQNAVNQILRHPEDKPTIGLLLVKGKNKTVVEYSLMGYTNPIGVADWKEKLDASIPEDIWESLPTIEQIERELSED